MAALIGQQHRLVGKWPTVTLCSTNNLQIDPKCLDKNFCILLFFFCGVTNYCLQTSATRWWLTKVASLIVSLFNITSTWEVPFGILQYVQCNLHKLAGVFPTSLLMAKVSDLVVAHNGFLLHATMEIIHIFHTGY